MLFKVLKKLFNTYLDWVFSLFLNLESWILILILYWMTLWFLTLAWVLILDLSLWHHQNKIGSFASTKNAFQNGELRKKGLHGSAPKIYCFKWISFCLSPSTLPLWPEAISLYLARSFQLGLNSVWYDPLWSWLLCFLPSFFIWLVHLFRGLCHWYCRYRWWLWWYPPTQISPSKPISDEGSLSTQVFLVHRGCSIHFGYCHFSEEIFYRISHKASFGSGQTTERPKKISQTRWQTQLPHCH